MHEYDAGLVRVKDGDTFVLMIDQGFANFTLQPIRVLNYSAPELSTADGPHYKDIAENILRNGKITVKTYRDRRTFERWLAEVWIDGVSFPEAMAAHGAPSQGETPIQKIKRDLDLLDSDMREQMIGYLHRSQT